MNISLQPQAAQRGHDLVRSFRRLTLRPRYSSHTLSCCHRRAFHSVRLPSLPFSALSFPSSRSSLPHCGGLRVSQQQASFARHVNGGKGESAHRGKKGDADEAADSVAETSSAKADDDDSAPLPPVTMSRAEMARYSTVLTDAAAPPSAPAAASSGSVSRAQATGVKAGRAVALGAGLSLPAVVSAPTVSLRVPLLAGSDVIDPAVKASLAVGVTADDILSDFLLNTQEKLVMTPDELAVALSREAEEERRLRALHRRYLRTRGKSKPEDVRLALAQAQSEDGSIEYIDAIDEHDDNEELIADNPESMRRRRAIELKAVRQGIRDRHLDLEEQVEVNRLREETERAKQRAEETARQLRRRAGLETAEDEVEEDAAYDPARRLRDAEAKEALEAAKLRENAIFRYREQYGEREGEDYALKKEERLYEKPDVPPQPPPAPRAIIAKLRPREVDSRGRSHGSGGRKASRAVVWIQPGTGESWVNHLNHAVYFTRFSHRVCLLRPFEVTGTMGQYDVRAFVSGGGKTGQSGAVQLAIAKALVKQEPLLRERLKKEMMLTRDTRKVERKKPGKPKARKSYTFVKR